MNTLFILPLAIQGFEWIIILFVVLILFGAKKIPELMRALGQGLSNFKKGMHEVEADVKDIKEDLKSNQGTEEEKKSETTEIKE